MRRRLLYLVPVVIFGVIAGNFLWGALSALAIGLLLWPLLRRPAETVPRQTYDLGVYRDQLAEVAREAAEGRLGTEQAAAARAEIERRLLAAADAPGDPANPRL